MKLQLDRIDRQILNILQRNNRISNLQLAEEVSLSPPACLKRVKRLRESGVIEADVAILNSRILGKMLNIIVEVEMIRDQADLADAFMRKMQLADEVTQCYQVTGRSIFCWWSWCRIWKLMRCLYAVICPTIRICVSSVL